MDELQHDLQAEIPLISTNWCMVHDSASFVKHYDGAIRRYLTALLKNSHDADEVAQEFFLSIAERGFPRFKRDKGRFRDYLKVSVRNAALNYLRKRRSYKEVELQRVSEEVRGERKSNLDRLWSTHWQKCLLDRAWQALKNCENQFAEASYYKVLYLCTAFPSEDSTSLAARASKLFRKPVRPESYRRLLSRARRRFAELLLAELVQTLDAPNPENIEDELNDLGLMACVRKFLPEDWQSSLPVESHREALAE